MAQDDLTTDRARNWIVAACCCFCNLTFYGVSRLSGIMLVAATHTFQVSRASAAVPFSLSTAVRNLAGVFVGHLGHRFGVGPVVATGCLIASLGSGLCFFAKDMQWLTVCWGGIFGFGFGLSTCLLPLAINQNFVKHNGTASGISYSGSYIGSFIFPPIVVWLLNTYGFQGTFLIISGGVLNVLVAAMLLRLPQTRKKYDIKRSSKDSLCSDSYEPNKGVNVTSKQVVEVEMWKQNINRAFLDSQCSLTGESDKSHFKTYISLGNSSHLLQEPVCLKRFTKNESASIFNNTLHSEISRNHHNLFPNLFKNFKFESTFPNDDWRNSHCEKSFSSQITSLHIFALKKDRDSIATNKCSNVYPAGCKGIIVKQVSIIPKMYLRKLLESRLLSKGKYKAKYKLKLQKLKKVIIASLLKNRALGEGSVQNDNVKLTYFKYLQSFLCPNSYYVAIPNKYFYLTVSHSILNRPCAAAENEKISDFTDSTFTLQQNSKSKKAFYLADTPRTKEVTNILPILDSLLKDNKNSILFSVNRHTHNKTTSNDDASAEEKQDSYYQFLPTNQNCDICSNKSSIYDDSSSSYKTEDSQSSYVPSFSSELSLQCESNKKSANRKDSSSSLSRSSGKVAKRCCSDWFHMLREPMFSVIGFTMSIQTFIVVCVVTTIEDFAKDVGIPENRTHYALMVLSISNFVGTLTLGSITDRGFISRHRFLSLCFFGMSLALVAVSLVAVSLPSLLSVIAIYGLLESGVIITFPILTKQFVKGERRQAVAIASSNVLSAPTVMLVPMLIGHFRDDIGSYSGLFHLLGATSFTCSLLWLVAPSICQRRRLKKKAIEQIATEC